MNKVLFVTHNYIRRRGDSAGVFLHLLAKKLLEQNVQVYVVAPHDKGCSEEETIDGIKIYRFRYADDDKETFAYRGDMHNQLFANPFKIFMLWKFLRRSYKLSCKVIDNENIDIVSLHWLIPNGYVAKRLQKKYNRLRLFVSSHGSDIRILSKFKFVYNYYLKKMVRKAKAYTVVSSHLENELLKIDSTIENKIKIMPLPNDETIFKPDKTIFKDNNLIVAVARLTMQKRLDVLIKAFKIAHEKNDSLKLKIYGDGPEKSGIAALISDLNLSSSVEIKEPVTQKELAKVYNKASLVVLNSYKEGFGLALTEAMLCKTAVIGTDSGGIKDIIDHNETGLLVPVDDADALADAMIRLHEDEIYRNRLALSGYENALKRFSSEGTAKAFTEMYGESEQIETDSKT